MKKIVLASAISALFAAPVAAFAQAKPAIPTLGQIFEASGITESGYIDAGYGALKNGAGFTTRVFDTNQNSFALNQVGLTLAKQPKEGFGGLVTSRWAETRRSFTPSRKVLVPLLLLVRCLTSHRRTYSGQADRLL